ncbi:hypothetical protein M9Y10_004375 [Tritrichomonas musculus]|uniref:Protein kinase domain-containing protein n=1 Tax=Tritrichomonas musculus TaxID=1915356 RepID=A0ABR2JT76_9EUKA
MSNVRPPSLPPLKKNIAPRIKKPSDRYLINVDDYQIINKMNQGGFGIIYLVRNIKTKEEFVAKINKNQTDLKNEILISRELRILIQIQHPTIIQFRGFSYTDFENQKNITIFMDYMKNGSLADLIANEANGLCKSDYDNTKRQIILIGIARGMMILHSRHVIHRDLKPENVLIGIDYHPRITDFGLSKFYDPHNSMSQSMSDSGTAQYMAPEVILSNHFNTKADVYAFGILMYELVTSERAYSDLLKGRNKITAFNLKTKVCEGLRPTIKERSMKKGQKLMIEKCWSKDPKERPTFKEIYKLLSMSTVDYITEFEDSNEPKIIPFIDDDDDEDEYCEFIGTRKFCFDDVDIEEILEYIDSINGEPRSLDKSNEQGLPSLDMKKIEAKMSQMESELAASKSEASRLREEADKMKSQMMQMSKKINDQSALINSLETKLSENKGAVNSSLYISAEMNLSSPGILEQLKMKEKTSFDRLFVASQSSRDIYNLIDPNTKDCFCTNNCGDFFIEFELEETIPINGIQIFSGWEAFPKSFDIIIEGRTVKSIKEAIDLNGKCKDMTIEFESNRCRRIRFQQTGPNWDKNNNFLFIKRIELLSPETKYSGGVFKTLFYKNENKDPHKIGVHITSTAFDFNNFYSIKSTKNICTANKENQWFQIELTRSVAILNGFRLKKSVPERLKSYKIICTDDASKPTSSWTTLTVINEKTKGDHQDLDIYEFDHPSPPVRFIRLIQTDKNWNDNLFLKFIHFDLFGRLSLDDTINENIKNISDLKSKIGRFFSVDTNIDTPGILEQLKMKEKTPFDRLFIVSQSSRDIYNLIDPNTKDYFYTNNCGDFFIEFELEETIPINGIQIFSGWEDFPKSFDIIIEGRTVKSIKEAIDLNGKYKDMTIKFESNRCRRIRFQQTGPNWDENNNFLLIERIELLSPETKYSGGVFKTLFYKNENKDPHKIGVHITSTTFDFNNFYSIKSTKNICTANKENQWFQIELTRSVAILNGFRLKKSVPERLKSYKIICTDDASKPTSSWTTLTVINEKTKGDHQDLDIYEFDHPSPPVRFIRLIQTDKNWNDNLFLKFIHFDLFGRLSLDDTINENIKNISDLKSKIGRFFSVDTNIDTPGIIEQLKMKEKTPFDRLFIVSQSSRDIYNLIDPNTKDYFYTNNCGDFFIEFELEETIPINGIQIFSGLEDFPKSFDIIIEGRTVKSIKEAIDLNGKYKDMTIKFESNRCRRIRFQQTGPNWDENNNFLLIERIELLSPETKYSGGVFKTLFYKNENKDPHKIGVHITSTAFDFNNFYSIKSTKSICTANKENQWFQIELTRSVAILNGFRLKKSVPERLKSYKIICTDDASKPTSSWTTLTVINEKTKGDHQDLDIYEFDHPSPPVRFIRLIQTGKNWNDNLFLIFYHFDLFGSCF